MRGDMPALSAMVKNDSGVSTGFEAPDDSDLRLMR